MTRLARLWGRYKYRFVPWIASDFSRQIEKGGLENVEPVGLESARSQLLKVLSALFRLHANSLRCNATGSERKRWDSRLSPSVSEATASRSDRIVHLELGFHLQCLPSGIGPEAGLGVFVLGDVASGKTNTCTQGRVATRGDLMAIYPGTFYTPGEPLFWASLGNPYIFRCADGILLDANCRGLSASIFRSLLYRDSIPHRDHVAADSTWMSSYLSLALNPLSVGQFVNNATIPHEADGAEPGMKKRLANVAYCEMSFGFPEEIHPEWLQLLPYLYCEANVQSTIMRGERDLKVVALVATKDIFHGDELFSTYFTVVPS